MLIHLFTSNLISGSWFESEHNVGGDGSLQQSVRFWAEKKIVNNLLVAIVQVLSESVLWVHFRTLEHICGNSELCSILRNEILCKFLAFFEKI